MYNILKNKFFVGFVVVLIVNFVDLSAEQKKTWYKDSSGRILIYRAEPSKLEALVAGIISLWGLPFICIGLKPEMYRDTVSGMIGGMFVLGGTAFSGTGIYLLNEWYHDYDSLHKPLIVIDKHGISYEGKEKILWKNLCGYQRFEHIIFTNNGTIYTYSLEITTDVDKFHIYEKKIAITLSKLHQLIDEAYSAYQISKKKFNV